MANRIKGESSFDYDGAAIAVCINMEGLLAAEDETGIDLATLLPSAMLSHRAVLLRHAIIQGGGDASRSEAAEMLMDGPAAKAWAAAFNQAFPPASEDEGKAKK